MPRGQPDAGRRTYLSTDPRVGDGLASKMSAAAAKLLCTAALRCPSLVIIMHDQPCEDCESSREVLVEA